MLQEILGCVLVVLSLVSATVMVIVKDISENASGT